ncbi:hypothetical protein [Sagittula stellata]|uniref:Uncharacterized protein n=1 Tax=Sagittula stellata (strain ATCC 700073 / DSM 11524 / E-37) TaxID=388399 RepID=A3K5I4_SAGS3|nr:hypothetical protein [Sagittula stellata]EBA07373.1 hypothetical protein SSE37_21280 [Sagittula stellata E-37]
MTGDIVFFLILVLLAGLAIRSVRDRRRRKRRRDTLHRDGDGVWLWTDFDGTEHRSNSHPDRGCGASGTSDDASSGGGDGGGD